MCGLRAVPLRRLSDDKKKTKKKKVSVYVFVIGREGNLEFIIKRFVLFRLLDTRSKKKKKRRRRR